MPRNNSSKQSNVSNEGSSSRRRRSLMGSYIDPRGETWYEVKREFVNKPIYANVQFTYVGHIMIHAYDRPPIIGHLTNDGLRWPKLFDKRCKLEVYCQWHEIPVPKAHSANLCQNEACDDDNVISRLEREIDQMQQRLDRFHAIQYVKNEHFDPICEVSALSVRIIGTG
ncbi:hypothetical protein F0562_034123 [Nyssa sinensis]|uniref:Uncharacterized protein n=1 Tax=Nyssa sinensis TaxID=561372 RepID=A0A5J5AJW0_9ASTE|nr:hypothetical protein F0562_034123 [Nyssa sinensis]